MSQNLDLLETDRLVLSGWRADQIEDLVRLHGDPRVSRYLRGDGQPWSRESMEAALAHWIELFETQRLGKLRVRRKSDGVLVGRAGYGVYGPDKIPEIGYSLYPEFWGNGYAFEAASALRDWFFRETEWDHFLGMADVRNAASIRILRGIGMTPLGPKPNEDGKLCEFHIYYRPAAS
jgi:ribosomal-protein-alanine N-acetyltransferase